jgi:hypothetical protein
MVINPTRLKSSVESRQQETHMPIDEVTRRLLGAGGLSTSLIASMSGVTARSVQRWRNGIHHPKPAQQSQLQLIDDLVQMVEESGRPWVPRNWLIGLNPWLDERAPHDLVTGLLESDADADTRGKVVSELAYAATAFAESYDL